MISGWAIGRGLHRRTLLGVCRNGGREDAARRCSRGRRGRWRGRWRRRRSRESCRRARGAGEDSHQEQRACAGVGREGERWLGGRRQGPVLPPLEMRGDMGRYGEIRGDVGRYGEMWGDTGRYGEMWGDMGLCSASRGASRRKISRYLPLSPPLSASGGAGACGPTPQRPSTPPRAAASARTRPQCRARRRPKEVTIPG